MKDHSGLRESLERIVGKENVITDEQLVLKLMDTYQGLMQPAKPVLMLYAYDADQIQKIINCVREDGSCGLVVCSSEGQEKLTANSLPAPDTECILLNLSRMKRIFRGDEKNRVVFAEPGVTFAELEERLEGTGLKLDYPFLARPDKSVIAALLAALLQINWSPVFQYCFTDINIGITPDFAGLPRCFQESDEADADSSAPERRGHRSAHHSAKDSDASRRLSGAIR